MGESWVLTALERVDLLLEIAALLEPAPPLTICSVAESLFVMPCLWPATVMTLAIDCQNVPPVEVSLRSWLLS
jgi:hypothetical protein